MFTGIVTDQGKITKVSDREKGRLFKIATAYDTSTIDIGASIACNGVCLTVVGLSKPEDNGSWFEVEAWAEAMQLTNAGKWSSGTTINLERSLKMGDEFGGHMVSGHVDGMAEIVETRMEGEATRFYLKLPDHLSKFVVSKGSITLDGTSLTVNEIDQNIFDVLIISHTLKVTTWGQLKAGDPVNIEVDQMARYVIKVIEQHRHLAGSE